MLARATGLYEQARGDIAAYAIEQAMSRLDEAVETLGGDSSEGAAELRLRIAMSRTWGSFAKDPGGTQRELDRVAAEAASLARDAGLDRFAYMALHNRGFVEYLRGDLPAALRLMVEADRLEAPADRGIAHLDRGRVLIEAGLVTDAWETLQTAASSLAEAGTVDHAPQAACRQAVPGADLAAGLDAAAAPGGGDKGGSPARGLVHVLRDRLASPAAGDTPLTAPVRTAPSHALRRYSAHTHTPPGGVPRWRARHHHGAGVPPEGHVPTFRDLIVLSRMITRVSGTEGTLERAVGPDRKGQVSPVLYGLGIVAAFL